MALSFGTPKPQSPLRLCFTIRSVVVTAGAIALPVIPNGPTYHATFRVIACIADFAPTYAALLNDMLPLAAIDDTFTIRPYRLLFIHGTTARIHKNVPRRLNAIV